MNGDLLSLMLLEGVAVENVRIVPEAQPWSIPRIPELVISGHKERVFEFANYWPFAPDSIYFPRPVAFSRQWLFGQACDQ